MNHSYKKFKNNFFFVKMKSLIKYKTYLPLCIYFYKPFLLFGVKKKYISNFCPIFIRKYF